MKRDLDVIRTWLLYLEEIEHAFGTVIISEDEDKKGLGALLAK